MLLKVLKLAIVDYWWNGYRILPKRMRAMNRNPVKWFCFEEKEWLKNYHLVCP